MTHCSPCRSLAPAGLADLVQRDLTPSRILVVLLGVLSLLGCTPAPPPDTPPAAAIAFDDLNGFLTELETARHDPAAWAERLNATDPDLAVAAEQIRANLAQFDVRFTATGDTHPLTTPARGGAAATVHGVDVDWAVPGHPPATHRLWFTLTTRQTGLLLVGLTDGPATDPVPLWALGPVQVAGGAQAAVLAGADVDVAPWLNDLGKALRTLEARGIGTSPLLVQVPAQPRDFQRLLGVRPTSHRAVAAVTWPFGAAAHVVINPQAALFGPTREVLVTHEAVHVATGSLRPGGPLWLAEGYADLVALTGQPEVTAAHERHLADDQRRHGIATTLVTEADLDPDNPRVDAHYQRAWVTVRVLDRAGIADRIHAAVQAGTPLSQALAAEGWTEQSLAHAVTDELTSKVG